MLSPSDCPFVTRIDRAWMLGPFSKELQKRRREKTLIDALDECVTRLLENPRHTGLNLETLRTVGGRTVLSARIDRAFRLILTPLSAREIGLLYFDNHDEAYRWVDRNARQIPTMLSRIHEVTATTRISGRDALIPAVRGDEDDPIAIASAGQWRQLLEDGPEHYLSYLDDDQRTIAQLQTRSLLLIKGGAGTGKTAVAVHRALWLARQPQLEGLGPSKVLYVCFNRSLAQAVEQMMRALSGGALPDHLEVRTIHSWCGGLIAGMEPSYRVGVAEVLRRIRHEYLSLPPEQKRLLAPRTDEFVAEEIDRVIRPNGFSDRAAYLGVERKGRKAGLRQPARNVVWDIYERVVAWQNHARLLSWNDIPIRALDAVADGQTSESYRAIIIDEGQDCTRVMVCLAKRLIGANGQLTVLADPAQEIYGSGFHWTSQELRPRGGNTRWLRKTYRTTRQIFDLARPLLDGNDDLKEDLEMLSPPERLGPKPVGLACESQPELIKAIVRRIQANLTERRPSQIGVIASSGETLRTLATALTAQQIRSQVITSDGEKIRLAEPSVKLITMHSAKGLDFPIVYVMAPRRCDRGWEPDSEAEGRRRLYVALTRSSLELTVGLIYGQQHPLVSLLDPALLEPAGSHGLAFVNTAGSPTNYDAS